LRASRADMTVDFPLPGAPLISILLWLMSKTVSLTKIHRMSVSKEDEFYSNLKQKLNDQTAWPSLYLFKFIIISNEDKVEALTKVFEKEKNDISLKPSSAGKYVSFSVKTMMLSADAVIAKYKEVGKIEGVIAL